ncbi:MAG: autotransporter-associated beta strand repeat-containing protein, partial [Pirellulales bacterium]|nr:autotransporter-associated beta strand repeat-containing protein [Pirellulales bacterium]
MNRFLKLFFFLLVAGLMAFPVQSFAIVWQGTSASPNDLWSIGANWDTATPPTSTDVVYIDDTDVPIITYTGTYVIPVIDSTVTAVANQVLVGSITQAELDMTGGTLGTNLLRVGGTPGTSVVNLSGGTINNTGTGGSTRFGWDSGSGAGTGNLNMSNAAVFNTAGNFIVGYDGGTGSVQMANSSQIIQSSSTFFVGLGGPLSGPGTGTLAMSDSAYISTPAFTVAQWNTAGGGGTSGTVTMLGTSQIDIAGEMILANAGELVGGVPTPSVAQVTLGDPTAGNQGHSPKIYVNGTGGSNVGIWQYSQAHLDLYDSAVFQKSTGALTVGDNWNDPDGLGTSLSEGFISVHDSASMTLDGLRLGNLTFGRGTLTLGDGTDYPTVTCNWLNNGENSGAVGTINLNSGSLYVGGWLQNGLWAGGTGHITVSGGSLYAGATNIGGGSGTGYLTITGGNATYGDFFAGNNPGASGTVLVSGGTLTSNGWVSLGLDGGSAQMTVSGTGVVDIPNGYLYVGRGSTGTFTQTGGTVNALIAILSENSSGEMNLDGGLMSVNYIQAGWGFGTGTNTTVNLNGGTLQARQTGEFIVRNGSMSLNVNVEAGGAIIDSNYCDITIPVPLKDGGGGGGLTKLTMGNLTLSAVNTYTGLTDVQGGTVTVARGGSLATTAISVANGATLDVSQDAAPALVTSVLDSMTLATGSNLTVGVPATTTNPIFDVRGTGGVLTLPTGGNQANVTLVVPGRTVATDVWYTLFKSTSNGGGNSANVNLINNALNCTITKQDVVDPAVQFKISNLVTKTVNWTGASIGDWTLGGGNEWDDSGTPVPYYDLYTVNFSDTPTPSTYSVNVLGNVHPLDMNVSGTGSYLFYGMGSIYGLGTTLTKSGAGTLQLSNTGVNTFTGAVSITGGTVIADYASSLGVGNNVTVDGAGTALNVNNNFMGPGSSKNLTVTNGATVSVTGVCYAGYGPGDPTIEVTDSTMSVVGSTRIGYRGGDGTLTLDNSTYTFGGNIEAGNSDGQGPSTGLVDMDASTITGSSNTNFHVGLRSEGEGTLNMSNGSQINMSGWILYVGYNDDYGGTRYADSVGTVNMYDTSNYQNPTGNCEMGNGAMSVGTVNMGVATGTDTASMNIAFLRVGGGGVGTLNMYADTSIVTSGSELGSTAGTTGTLNMHDTSSLTATSYFNIGNGNGYGELNMDGQSELTLPNNTGWYALGSTNGTAEINMSGNANYDIQASSWWYTLLGANQWDNAEGTTSCTVNLSGDATFNIVNYALAGHIWGSTTGNKTASASINISDDAVLTVQALWVGNGPNTDTYEFWRDDTDDGVDNPTLHGPYSQHASGTINITESGKVVTTANEASFASSGANAVVMMNGDDSLKPATIQSADWLSFGRDAGSTATVEMDGYSYATCAIWFNAGVWGGASANITMSGHSKMNLCTDNASWASLGVDGSATLTMNDDSEFVAGNAIELGGAGANGHCVVTLNDNASMTAVNSGIWVGNSAGSYGELNVYGNSTVSSLNEEIEVPWQGTGVLNVGDGNPANNAVVQTTQILLGVDASATSGTVNLNKGGQIVANKIFTGGAALQSVVNFDGGLLRAKSSDSAGNELINNNGGAVVFKLNVKDGGARIDTQAYADTITEPLLHDSGASAEDGGLYKTGTGTLILSQDPQYTGDTTVNKGALIVGTLNTPLGDVDVRADSTAVLIASSITANSLSIGVNASDADLPPAALAAAAGAGDDLESLGSKDKSAGATGMPTTTLTLAPSGAAAGAAPVPEPSTWILLILAGLGGLAAAR